MILCMEIVNTEVSEQDSFATRMCLIKLSWFSAFKMFSLIFYNNVMLFTVVYNIFA